MDLVRRRNRAQIAAFSNQDLVCYQLRLRCGLSMSVRASHAMHCDSLYLFKHSQFADCFIEIPTLAVQGVGLSPEPEDTAETLFHSMASPGLNKYAIRLPDKQLCFVIASADQWEQSRDATFLCHQQPFVRIYAAEKCLFRFAPWSSGIQRQGVWRGLSLEREGPSG